MKPHHALVTAALVAGVLAAGSAHRAAASGKAYYTAAQAAAGAKLYAQNCSRCHGESLEGVSGPALKGPSMQGSQEIADIYDFVSVQMPAGAPGSLSASAYAAIMAFILRENDYPAGGVALSASSAKRIKGKI
jgi:mono/diheme cytochrome c family protein